MLKPHRRVAPEVIEIAIKQILAYHRQGKRSLRQLPGKGAHGREEIQAQAEALNWNPTKVRKARQFALLYGARELDELFRLLRKHRPIFGIAHVGVLVTIPEARERAALQRWCITQHQSTADLERDLKTRRPDQRHGGRRRNVAAEPAHALVQLAEMADTWRRWFEVAQGESQGTRTQSVLHRLPRTVREQVEAVYQTTRSLHEVVSRQLARFRRQSQRQKRT